MYFDQTKHFISSLATDLVYAFVMTYINMLILDWGYNYFLYDIRATLAIGNRLASISKKRETGRTSAFDAPPPPPPQTVETVRPDRLGYFGCSTPCTKILATNPRVQVNGALLLLYG